MRVGRLPTLDLAAENRLYVLSFKYLFLSADVELPLLRLKKDRFESNVNKPFALISFGIIMKVTWSDGNLQVFAGDEIEILRGFGERDSAKVQATKIRNKTRGTVFTSSVEGILMTRMPRDFVPPILGYAKNIKMRGRAVGFELEEKAPPIVSGILRECAKFIDPKLYERCKDKDYHDVITNAFPILEDRIRAKIGVDPSYSGRKLIDCAFNPNTGKLTLGETKSEREAFYFIFQGALGFLRNPPSHRLTEHESDVETFEIICMVDLLLRIVDKAKLRPHARKIPTRDRSKKVTPKLPKELPGTEIEITRIRQEHSIKINDEALKPWLTKVENYCKIEVVYSEDVDKMVGVEPKNPLDLDFFDVAESHLESKYPDVLKAWEELKHVTFKHNKELALLLEEIRTLIVKEREMPCYYWGMRGDAPERYVRPDRLALHVYEIISHEIRTGRQWFGGKPKVRPTIYADTTFYELQWGNDSCLVKSQEEKEVEKYVPLIIQLVEASKYKDEVKSLLKKEDKIYKTKRGNFEGKIKDVIKSIELGKLLEGKCRFCS